MIVDFFLIAEDAAVDEAGLTDIKGGGVGYVAVPSFPGTVPPLVAVARLAIEPSDRASDHTILVRLRTDAGDELTLVERQRIPPDYLTPREGLPEGALATVVVVARMPSRVVHEPGLHQVEMEIDDEVIGGARFVVWQRAN